MSKNYTADLDKIIEQQEALLSSLKNEAKQLDGNRLLEENKALTAKLQVADEKNNRLENENSALKSQLADTKNALFVKMANEKLSAFSSVQKSIDGIYYREANNLDSRLDLYRRGCEKSINETLGYIDSLSSKEYALLEYLMHNQGLILSREKIENHIWNFDYEGGTNVVDVYISYLRRKIDSGHERHLIHTVRGRGYVLREDTDS